MKRTTQPRKALASPSRLGLLAAVSGFAIVGAITGLSAQSIGAGSSSGGFGTAGIPIGDDVYGASVDPLTPVGVGPAARSSGVQSVNSSRFPKGGEVVRRGRWVTSVTPFAEVSATYSDNINLEAEGFEDDELVITTTAGVTLGVQNERLAGQLSYAASYDYFVNETNDDGFRHNLDTAWSAAVVPNLFYIDVAGGIAETYSTNDRFSGNEVANADDRSRAFYGAISPSLRRNLGGLVNAELRYTLRGETFDDDSDDGGYSQTFAAGVTGDPRKFRRFGWQAATEYEIFTPEDDRDDITRWTSYVGVDVPVTNTVALTGTVGYDEFSDDIADDDLSGVFANAGVRWQPTTRFGARVYGGWRYDGFDYGAEAKYALRENLVAGLQARRGVQFNDFGVNAATPVVLATDQNGRQTFAAPNGRDTTNNLDDALAFNNLTGAQGRFGDIARNDQDDDAVVDTLRAYVAGKTGKTSWDASVEAAQFDYSSTLSDELVLSASASATRELTSRLALSGGVGFTAVSYDDPVTPADTDFETLSLGIGLDYQLTEIVNVFGRYTYTTRFADDSLDEFDENAGVIGVRASF